MIVAIFHWSSLGWAGLAFFLIVVGVGLGYMLLRLGGALGRLSSFLRGTEQELLPVIAKVGGSVESVDTAVRAVSFAVTTPVKKATGWTAGLRHGAASFKVSRDWRTALDEAKKAAARREADLVDELRRTGTHHSE